ncbi:MAG: hypothetical protein K1Y36_22390 [Blastocatellia bacterium]|nr:hypothetical protein [Blastocatellia bacterium]
MIEIHKKVDKDQNQVVLQMSAAEFDQLEKVLQETGLVTITEDAETNEPRESADATWQEEQRWMREHRAEYVGQWVALSGYNLISHGLNAKDVFAEAKAKGYKNPLFTQIEAADEFQFGGWI